MWLHWWNRSTAGFHRPSEGPTVSSLHGGIVLLLLSVIIQLVILEITLALCIREHLLLVITIDVSIVFVERVLVLVLIIVCLPGFPILSMCKFVMHSIFYLGTDSTH